MSYPQPYQQFMHKLFSAAFAHPAFLDESHFEKIKGNVSQTIIRYVTVT
jgi:hypothetical protein